MTYLRSTTAIIFLFISPIICRAASESYVTPGTSQFWTYIGICVFLVVFAGLMSGLTLGLLSLSPLDLHIKANSGEEREQVYAKKIIPLVKDHHLLLVTLLLCNAGAMEALPIFLDKLVPEFVAIIISVTMVLIFGEVLPQAVCSRNGLAIGANLSLLVRILSFVCYPLAKPIAKVLDVVLGEAEKEELRRAELKELVKLQSMAEGGKLVVDEVTIIHGALDMKEKTVGQVMQPIEKVFMLERNQVYDEELVRELLAKGHSRVPVYSETKDKIMGQILIKNLLGVSTNGSVRVKDLPLRQVHAVDVGKPLYDALNLFQRGKSHLAIVRNQSEVVGIATLEDIMEELIQEEIVDETDVYVDVNTQERVASRADTANISLLDDTATSGQFRQISRRRNSLTLSGLRPGLNGAFSSQITPALSTSVLDSRRPHRLQRAKSASSRDLDQTFPVMSQSIYSPHGSQTDLATPLLDES